MSKLLWLLCLPVMLFAGAHKVAHLHPKEQEFADKLSAPKRRVFCWRFSHTQRQAAMHKGDVPPDQAVILVMEETGMSLAVKSRKQTAAHSAKGDK